MPTRFRLPDFRTRTPFFRIIPVLFLPAVTCLYACSHAIFSLANRPQISRLAACGNAQSARRAEHLRSAATDAAATRFPKIAVTLEPFSPSKTVSVPVEQATIGRSVVIKGEVSGTESLYIDGRIEGTVNFAEHRVTIGRNGSVAANINAREVVILGKVQGNIQCYRPSGHPQRRCADGRRGHPAHQR